MKLGTQLFGCRKEFRQDPKGFLAGLKAAGYTQFEPCILMDKPEESMAAKYFAGELWSPEEVAGFKTMMAELGMELTSAHLFCSDISGRLSELKALAQENGITSYVLNLRWASMADTTEEELLDYAAELEALAQELAEVKCELWLHNTQGNLVGEPGESLLEKVLANTSHVYTQIDSGWAMYDGRNPEDLIAIPAIKLHGLHIKDMAVDFAQKSGEDIFAVLGSGCTNLKELLLNAEKAPLVVDQDLTKGDFLKDLEDSAAAVAAAQEILFEEHGNEWDTSKDQSILEVYDIETKERTVLAEFPYLIEAPNWSMDGKYLVFNSKGHICKYDLESGEVKEINTGFATRCNNDHVLSADGKYLAVSHSQNGWDSRVYILPLDESDPAYGQPREITPLAPSYLHGWSPDGKWLAYCAFREMENGADIYVKAVDGTGEEVRLTEARGLNDGPEYDPTGQYIWFNSVRTGLMQAWRMRADGSEQTQMTFDTGWNTWFPHVSPDGKQLVMIAYKKGDLAPGQHVPHKNVEIRWMPADGSKEPETIVELFGGQGTINVNSWAPDSKRFAFVSYRVEE